MSGIGRTAPDRTVEYLQSEQKTKLYRNYSSEPGIAVSRPRGKSPQQAALFTRPPQLNEESSLLASLCSLLGALRRAGAAVSRQALANLSRGELLCQAFEVYRDLVADPRIRFGNLVFLVRALAEGEELALAGCEDCGALTVVDRITFEAHRCPHCASRAD